MTVTELIPLARDNKRVSVYIDGEFSFVLYKGELSDYGLCENMQISDETLDSIIRDTLIPRAKKRGMNLLMSQDRTRCDIIAKLSEGGYPQIAIDEAVAYLESFHYIDDDRFARNYIFYKSSSMSRKQIYIKLEQKGVTSEIIDRIFEENSKINQSENGDANADELSLIKKLMLKRLKLTREDDFRPLDHMSRQKLYQYLYNKGFSINDIDKVYNHLT